jgi:MoaA/NifB/PqqE/SkfB family radical SAM enzyme
MSNPDREIVSLDEMARFAKDIIRMGVVHINLTGGEPLLAENFFEVIKSLQPSKVLITVNTNGLLLSDDMLDKLERAGVDIIKISIDSPIEDEHDKSRGYSGCFKQAVKALDYIKKKKKMLAQISTVCIKENLNSERIWKLVKMANDYNALLGLTIPAASGKWINAKDILLGEEERAVLKELIKIPHVIRDTDEAYLRSHCPAGSEEFYLTRYGDVIPCPLIQISFGNIKKETIYSIWKKMSDFKKFKNKQKSGCLAGEDKDFINKYLTPLEGYGHLPLSIENHPVCKDSTNDFKKDS